MFVGNEYLVTRYDNVIVDGNMAPGTVSCRVFQQCVARDCAVRSPHASANPFAVAHYINHGKPANALLYGVSYAHVPPHLIHLTPNVSFLPHQPPHEGVCAVALQPLNAGDELLTDYRFKGHHKPAWFH
eukprot:TRINITY_DN4938_c0_g1_i3.p1 TRINITY_DN4938_c0_g1~~TRINITY_DN4938_c0_g1_i3.p1  ORF type:complete len:129 (-),score=31.34 TRINITY_DN4938_c0_g1_i3:57-443(-)